MKKRNANARRLSVYLMKEEYQDFESVVKGNPAKYEVKRDGKIFGTLHVKAGPGHCPAWFSFFQGSVEGDLEKKLDSRTVSALFLLKRNGRIFAITFGYGRSLLNAGAWEERFGLKVVLNSIDPEKVRIIERKNLDTMLTQTRTQTSRECAIEEFALDVQQILLKAVTGEPRNISFAHRVSGADALSISCQVTLNEIESKCDELLKAFTAHDYEKEFPWFNNICEVTNRRKIEELNGVLVARIKANNMDRLFLAVPDIVEWTDIDGFTFREGDEGVLPDIFLSDFLTTVRNKGNLTCQHLRQRRVFLVYATTGVFEDRWSVYHCINCEIADSGKTYILTEGKWYEINASFVAYVNEQMKAVERYVFQLVAAENEKEVDYCRRLHESNKAHYALMDRKNIYHGGRHSQIEFCDLFTKDKKLIHLKRYAGSSVLSHLFAQGVNSARTFISDVEFRRKVNEKLPTGHKFDAETLPVSRDYEVVFGIISKTADELPEKLPFFSKITLMRAMQEIHHITGFKMSLAGIKVSP